MPVFSQLLHSKSPIPFKYAWVSFFANRKETLIQKEWFIQCGSADIVSYSGPLSSLTSILKFSDISCRCKQDDTVTFISTEDKRTQHFSIEAFSFLGDHQFVFMHCRVKICNATDPQSRCAQGCLQQRRKRSLWTNLGRDEEYSVSHGPFMRKDEEEQVRDVQDSTDDLLKKDIKGKPLIINYRKLQFITYWGPQL